MPGQDCLKELVACWVSQLVSEQTKVQGCGDNADGDVSCGMPEQLPLPKVAQSLGEGGQQTAAASGNCTI